MTAEDRVRAVLRAASRIVDAREPLGREAREGLPASTGLSSAGVELGMARLETSASDEEVGRLIASVRPAPRVYVILPGNVFVAASRALALALAASEKVVARPSRREPVLPSLLVRALELEGVQVTLADEIRPSGGEHVHAYGRDATLRNVAERVGSDVVVWGHGSGFGLVAVDAGCDVERLAEDVAVFDQRGCLSPRIVLFRGTERDAVAFGRELADALAELAARVPVGRIDAADLAAERAYLDAMRVAGEVLGAPGGFVAIDPDPRTLVLPDGPRVVHVARVDDAASALRLASPMSSHVVTLGGEGAFCDEVSAGFPRARRARVGAMQSPPFDGPVDLRAPSSGRPEIPSV